MARGYFNQLWASCLDIHNLQKWNKDPQLKPVVRFLEKLLQKGNLESFFPPVLWKVHTFYFHHSIITTKMAVSGSVEASVELGQFGRPFCSWEN